MVIVVPASKTTTGVNIVLTEDELKAQAPCCDADIHSTGFDSWACSSCGTPIGMSKDTPSSIIYREFDRNYDRITECVAGWLDVTPDKVYVELSWKP